jgi:hypothetical protein
LVFFSMSHERIYHRAMMQPGDCTSDRLCNPVTAYLIIFVRFRL